MGFNAVYLKEAVSKYQTRICFSFKDSLSATLFTNVDDQKTTILLMLVRINEQ